MIYLNKITSKPFLVICLLIFIGFSTAEKVDAFPELDYDGKADFGVFRPSERTWYSYSTESEKSSGLQWGLTTDVLVPADYDGDGLTDITVWRPENGVWYVHRSRDNELFAVQWGTTTAVEFGSIPDVPVPADYDADGLADFAVWRPDDGVWYVLQSSDGYNPIYAVTFEFGELADVPVQADYDGDGRADFAVFRSTENRWYIRQSSDNRTYSVGFGAAGEDLLVPADYTGDGRADLAVYRRGTWLIRDTQSGQIEILSFGNSTDKPVPADYDGDRKTDVAVYRNGTWFILNRSTQQFRAFYYGSANDTPLASTGVKPSIVPVP